MPAEGVGMDITDFFIGLICVTVCAQLPDKPEDFIPTLFKCVDLFDLFSSGHLPCPDSPRHC